MIIDVRLHLMNGIAWIYCSDCSLILSVFENQTNYRIDIPNHNVCFMIKMLRCIPRMMDDHIGRWHFRWNGSFYLCHGTFVKSCPLTIIKVSILNINFSLFSSETSLLLLKAVLILFHLRFNVLLSDCFLWRH